MFCPNCGANCEEGTVFCGACGAKIQTAEPVNEQPFQPEQPAQQPQYTAPAQQPGQNFYAAPRQQQGFYAQQPAQNFYAAPQAAGQFYAAPQAAPKKKKTGKKVAIGIVSVVAVLALLVGLAFVVFPKQAKALFAKIFYSNEKYFATIEKDELDDHAADIASTLEKTKDRWAEKRDSDTTVFSAHMNIDESILESLSEMGGLDLDWLSEIGVEVKFQNGEETGAVSADVMLGENKLFTLDVRTDNSDSKVYVRVPEISDKYIALTAEDVGALKNMVGRLGALSGMGGDDYGSGLLSSLPISVPSVAVDDLRMIVNSISADDVEKIVSRYGKIILDGFEKVDKETEEIEIDGVTEKLTAYKSTLTTKGLFKIIKSVCEEVKEDKEIERILKDITPAIEKITSSSDSIGIIGGMDIYPGLIDTIDNTILPQIDAMIESAGDDVIITYTLYMSGSEARGRVIEVSGDSEITSQFEGFRFSELKVEKDGTVKREVKLHIPEISLPFGDYDYSSLTSSVPSGFKLLWSGKEDGDIVSGDAVISIENDGGYDDIIKLTFDNFDKESVKDGKLNGSVSLSALSAVADYIPNMSTTFAGTEIDLSGTVSQLITQFKLKLDFEVKSGVQNYKASVKMLGKDIFSVEGIYGTEKSKDKAEVPESGDYIDFNDGRGFEDWMKTADLKSFVKGLKSAGIPASLLEKLEGALEDIDD